MKNIHTLGHTLVFIGGDVGRLLRCWDGAISWLGGDHTGFCFVDKCCFVVHCLCVFHIFCVYVMYFLLFFTFCLCAYILQLCLCMYILQLKKSWDSLGRYQPPIIQQAKTTSFSFSILTNCCFSSCAPDEIMGLCSEASLYKTYIFKHKKYIQPSKTFILRETHRNWDWGNRESMNSNLHLIQESRGSQAHLIK